MPSLMRLDYLHPCMLQDYIAGRWRQARESFEVLLHARTTSDGRPLEDAPTKALLAYMAGHGYVAPAGWSGVRELVEK